MPPLPNGQSALGTYNNLMEELKANPYRFRYSPFGSQKEVLVQQNFEFGIGGVLWDCELILTKYVTHQSQQQRWNNATVVELGSGTAMAAIACWQLGGRVIATDLPEVASLITQTNINLNTAAGNKQQRKNCAVMPLSWGVASEGEDVLRAVASMQAASAPMTSKSKEKGTAKLSSAPGVIDFIIAADVVYRSEDHEKLLTTLMQLADPERTTIIFVHRERFSNDSNFVQPLKSAFRQIQATNAKTVLPNYPKENATIYEFRGRLAPTVHDTDESFPVPTEEGEDDGPS
jgi:predicted nicotinamide N-methyase